MESLNKQNGNTVKKNSWKDKLPCKTMCKELCPQKDAFFLKGLQINHRHSTMTSQIHDSLLHNNGSLTTLF